MKEFDDRVGFKMFENLSAGELTRNQQTSVHATCKKTSNLVSVKHD
jgi:hypothetical protein